MKFTTSITCLALSLSLAHARPLGNQFGATRDLQSVAGQSQSIEFDSHGTIAPIDRRSAQMKDPQAQLNDMEAQQQATIDAANETNAKVQAEQVEVQHEKDSQLVSRSAQMKDPQAQLNDMEAQQQATIDAANETNAKVQAEQVEIQREKASQLVSRSPQTTDPQAQLKQAEAEQQATIDAANKKNAEEQAEAKKESPGSGVTTMYANAGSISTPSGTIKGAVFDNRPGDMR